MHMCECGVRPSITLKGQKGAKQSRSPGSTLRLANFMLVYLTTAGQINWVVHSSTKMMYNDINERILWPRWPSPKDI